MRSRYEKEKQGFPLERRSRDTESPTVDRKKRWVLLVVIEEQGTAGSVVPTEGRYAKLREDLVTTAKAAEVKGMGG